MSEIKKVSEISRYDTKTNKKVPLKSRFTLWSIGVMILLPIICCALNYLNAYYGGDIEHVTLSIVLDYTSQIASALVPYAAIGLLIWGQHRYGLSNIKLPLLMAFIGFFIPYISLFIIEALLGSIRLYYKAYLLYSLLYLFDAALLCASLAMIPLIRRAENRRKTESKNTLTNNRERVYGIQSEKIKATAVREAPESKKKKREKLPSTLRRASLYAILIRLAVGISTESYYAVVFFRRLATEYYRKIYTEELVVMIGLFALQFVYAAIGLFIMRTEMRIAERNYRYASKRESVGSTQKSEILTRTL